MIPAINLAVGLPLVLSSALIIAVCLPLLKGQIKPNALYGIRVGKSFESDENWFKMNRYGARQMIIWSAVMIACGLITFFLPLQKNLALLLFAGVVPLLLLVVPIIQIYRYSKTL